jgi:hypothetical protein
MTELPCLLATEDRCMKCDNCRRWELERLTEGGGPENDE